MSIALAWKEARESAASGAVPLVQYQRDPLGFFVRELGIPERTIRWSLNPGYADHAWDGTPEPLIAMLEGLVAWDDVGVESGTGTGKSFGAAATILWFLASWQGARVFTFAPKEDQLRLYIWTEIGKLWPSFQRLFPSAVKTDLCIRMNGMDDSWGARGYAVALKAGEQVSTNAQGMHAEHMLLVYEEFPGIAWAVAEAGENTSTAPHNLRLGLGNPDNQFDALHRFCVSPGVRHIRISALDHPNLVSADDTIVPGAASRKTVARRLANYGETGRLYQSRVRGISPSESAEALIKLEWVKAAQARWADPMYRMGKKALGVDVANSVNGDEGAIARGEGACLVEVEAFPCPNANDLGFRVHLEMKDKSIEAEHVGVDSVGVGAGTVNELRKRDRWIKALGGGDTPKERYGEDEEFNNLRSQIMWTIREDLRLGHIALPVDDELTLDLTTPQWKTQNGKIVVEQKEDIKKRLPSRRSPNKGDAAGYWNFVRDRTPIAEPLKNLALTTAQRVWKELDDMDKDKAPDKHRYGHIIRQG